MTGNSAMPVPKDPGNGEGFKYSDLVSYANAMDQLSGQEIEENRLLLLWSVGLFFCLTGMF